MSQENVEIVQTALSAYFGEDEATMRELFAPGAIITPPPDQPDAGNYYGYDGFVQVTSEWFEAWTGYDFEVLRVWAAEDAVFVTARQRARGRSSGVAMETEVALVFTLAQGKVTRLQMFATEQEALKAVGLAEQAMSQENVEIVRRAFVRVLEGERAPAPNLFRADAQYHTLPTDPDAAVHRGIDEIGRHFRDWKEAYPDLRSEPVEMKGNGDNVFVWVRLVGHGASSGIPVVSEYAQVWTLREGRVSRVVEYGDRAEALEAVGLAEQ